MQADAAEALARHQYLGAGSHCCSLCGPFMDIQPLIHTPQGTRLNPLKDAVKNFSLLSDPGAVVIPAGDTVDMAWTVQAEENHYGDFLVNQHILDVQPVATLLAITLTSKQTDRVLMNAPVLDRFVFGTGQLPHCLSCCYLIQATNFVQIKAHNVSAAPATVVNLTARGRRFLPYEHPELREQLLDYWDAQRSTPFWLTIDRLSSATGAAALLPGGGVRIPAGTRAVVILTVPGGGSFEAGDLQSHVVGVGGAVAARDILAEVKEGVGRSIQSGPIPLNMISQTLQVGAGFEGGEFRPASGHWCKGFSQFWKPNTRMRIELENGGAFPADVYLTWPGCMHYYGECAPGRSLERALSLEPVVGPRLRAGCPPQQQLPPGMSGLHGAEFADGGMPGYGGY